MSAFRKLLGQERIGTPFFDTFETLVDAVDARAWPGFRREPVGAYFGQALGNWIPGLIDSVLTDSQLRSINPAASRLCAFLLLRDFFRHNHAAIRPNQPDAEWVEELFGAVAADLQLPNDPLLMDATPFSLDDPSQAAWATGIAAYFGIPALKLFVVHASCAGPEA